MRTALVSSFALFVSIAAVACGSSGDGKHDDSGHTTTVDPSGGDPTHHDSSGTDDTRAESENGQCSAMTLHGTKGEGQACSAAQECAPTCCSCENGAKTEWLGARCQNGKCSSSTICGIPEKVSFYCQ